MARRAVELAVAATLLALSLSHASCDRIRVDLSPVFPAKLESSSLAGHSPSRRQAITRIALPGFSSSVSSGDPALPCRLIYVALPPDADLRSVSVVRGSYSTTAVPGSYDVLPVPSAATSDGQRNWGPGKQVREGRNQKTYARDAFYPSQHIRVASVSQLRSWKIAAIEYWPYAHNPKTGQLRLLKGDGVELQFRRDRSASPPKADPVAAAMAGFVNNKQAAARWYAPSPSSTSSAPAPGYAIITTNAIKQASHNLRSLAVCLGSRGFAARIVTEDDWGGGIGDVAAEHIRAWLRENYLRLNLQYVLLIGNPHPVLGDVPMKMLWPRKWSSSYREAPSDYYYADLTGNWDRDGDGYAGEEPDDFGIGGIDRIPEVYVGRIPFFGNIDELDRILNKTILYKSAVRLGWNRRCLMAMKPLDASTPSYQLGEQITADVLSELEINPVRVYDSTYPPAVWPERYPCDYDVVLNEWSAGAGLVLWMTHGTYNTASSVFISSRCAYLDDARPSIVYMASCSNGQPEHPGSLGYSVLARGGASTLSASRVSWYYVGETDFRHSDSIGGIGYHYARLVMAMKSCGQAAMDARLIKPVSIWPNHLVFNLYGDPSITYDHRRTISSAKHIADGALVTIDRCVISRVKDAGECYVQDVDHYAAIRVLGSWDDVPVPGALVRVVGRMHTEGAMRVLREAHITSLDSSPPVPGVCTAVKPVGLLNREIGDSKTLGLLVTVWGRVVSSSQNTFIISDGSRSQGLDVSCLGAAVPPSAGSVKVTGISTIDGVIVYAPEDIIRFRD